MLQFVAMSDRDVDSQNEEETDKAGLLDTAWQRQQEKVNYGVF